MHIFEYKLLKYCVSEGSKREGDRERDIFIDLLRYILCIAML